MTTLHPEASYSLLRFAFTRFPGRFIVFMLGTLGCAIASFTVDQVAGKAALVGIAVAIQAILWIGSWQHRKRLRKLNATPGNFHYPDVCEGCDPVRFNDGRPLTPMYAWVAAIKNISREDADQLLDDMPAADFHTLRSEYGKYLDHPQFSKFQTK